MSLLLLMNMAHYAMIEKMRIRTGNTKDEVDLVKLGSMKTFEGQGGEDIFSN